MPRSGFDRPLAQMRRPVKWRPRPNSDFRWFDAGLERISALPWAAVMAITDLGRLEALTDGEYQPEPPQRHLLVDLIAGMAERKGGGLVTPHHHGGSPRDRVMYEHAAAPAFWAWIEDFITIDVLRDRDVLDVGCGWGGKALYWAEHAAPRTVTGVDLPALLDPSVATAMADERGIRDLRLLTADAAAMPFDDCQFDVAVMDDVLEHVARPDLVLHEAHRTLRPGGVLIAKFPSFKMMREHHLDRAIPYRGAHYVLPIRTWAAGLNSRLLRTPTASYRPFAQVVRTEYHPAITSNLNGMSFADVKRVVAATDFTVGELRMLGLAPDRLNPRPAVVRRVYEVGRRIPVLGEFLSRSILLIAYREAA
jgi:2-polyprenyl-3-methyl-5-hydroxy-6-metoxy-1,4-benzoquinol methylase